MYGLDLLKHEAILKRNAAILAAKREYVATLKEIAALERKLGIPKLRTIVFSDYSTLNVTTVAKAVLREGKLMALIELVLEIQRRGCRSADDRSAVAKAIQHGLNHHYRRFFNRAIPRGRWSVRRLTNGHSKSLKHHTAMQALFVAWYNFARKHETLKGITPALASGLSDHVMDDQRTNRTSGSRLRFSIKHLLIAIAVCSVLLAAIVWLARSIDLKIPSGTLEEMRRNNRVRE